MNFEESGNTLRCRFSGDLGAEVCMLIDKELNNRVAGFLKDRDEYEIVFDLKGTRYMSSAFLRLCLFNCKIAGNKNFRIENTTEDLKRIFQIAGFTEMMNIQ